MEPIVKKAITTPHFSYKHIKHESYKKPVANSKSSVKNHITIKSTYSEAMNYFEELHSKFKSGVRAKNLLEGNPQEKVVKELKKSLGPDSDRAKFAGGTPEDLFKTPDMSKYNSMKKILKNSNIFKNLRTSLGETPRRRRTSSAYDGDYDHDKKWDLEPFNRADRLNSNVTTLTLYAYMSFNSKTSSRTIDRYGALIAALVDILESHGIVVRIELVKCNLGFCNALSSTSLVDRITIKDFGEYLPPPTLVRVFSSNFYRRVLFTRIVIAAHETGQDADYGLGAPTYFTKEVEFVGGGLHVYSHSALDEGEEEKFITELTKALGVNNEHD